MTAANRPDADPADRAPARRSEAVEQAAQVLAAINAVAAELADPRVQRPGMQRRRQWADRLDRAANLLATTQGVVVDLGDGVTIEGTPSALSRHGVDPAATTQGAGDGETRVEWHIADDSGRVHFAFGPSDAPDAEESLRRTCARPELGGRYHVVRRTVTTFPGPIIGPWEPVDQQAHSE